MGTPHRSIFPDDTLSKEQTRLIGIVSGAPEFHISDCRRTADRVRSTWWNSRNAVSVHRPEAPTNAQRPSSRRQTSRRTAAGMCREPSAGDVAVRGREVSAKRFRSRFSTSSVIARSKISAASPDGTA